jgi:cell division septation protein DedD
LASLALPMLAMTVMLGVGGLALASAGMRAGRVELPIVSAPPRVQQATPEPRRGIAAPIASSQPMAIAASSVPVAPGETWVVQAAAFSSASRASAMVDRLAAEGFPAYLVAGSLAARGLTVVRLGPYESAGEADAIREHLRSMPDYEGAFIRNLTAEP